MPWNGCPQYQFTMTLVGAASGEVEALAEGDRLADEIWAGGFVHLGREYPTARRPCCAMLGLASMASGRLVRMNILFVGDVFGQPGREALLRWLPGLPRGARRRLRDRQRRERGQRRRHHLQDRRAGCWPAAWTSSPPATTSGGRRRSTPSSRRTSASCGRPTTRAGAPGRGLTVRPAADGARGRGHQPRRRAVPEHRHVAVPHRRPARRRGPAAGRDDRRRPARRGDQREGRHGPLPGRARDRRAGHAHARADERRARAPRRHRLHDRRRHDRARATR